MKLLITGVSGLLGSHLAAAAIAEGHEVVAHSRRGDLSRLRPLGALPLLHRESGDLADRRGVCELLDRWKPEAVLHVAARIPVDPVRETPFTFFDDNARATLNLLHAASQSGATRFVFSSTMSVYGVPEYLPVDEGHPLVPENAYGLSKLEGEWYARLHSESSGMRVTVLRYSGIYGKGQRRGAIPAFIGRCAVDAPVTLHARGRQSSDFVWVEDVARANLLALRAEGLARFDVFNIGAGIEISVAELADKIREMCRSNSHVLATDESCGRDFRFAMDIRKARKALGYAPTPQEVAFARCIEQWAQGEWCEGEPR